MDTGGAAYLAELFTPSIAIVTQLKKLHHFSHLAVETSLQCNCSSKYSAGYRTSVVMFEQQLQEGCSSSRVAMLKFRFSEKATKIGAIFVLVLTYYPFFGLLRTYKQD